MREADSNERSLPGEAVGTSILAGVVTSVAVAIAAVMARAVIQSVFEPIDYETSKQDQEAVYLWFFGCWCVIAVASSYLLARHRVPYPFVSMLTAFASMALPAMIAASRLGTFDDR